MHEVRDLDGYTVARAQVQNGSVTLTMFSPGGTGETGHYYPPESISLANIEAIELLHTLLAEMLAANTEQANGRPISDPELGRRL